MAKEIPMVVTTAHKGVFFGYGDAADVDKKVVELHRARMCVYWDASCHGVLGLASDGPKLGSKVGPAVPRIFLQDVTSVMECTPTAVELWEKGPWS